MELTVEAGVGTGIMTVPSSGPVVQIDEGRIQAHLHKVVRFQLKMEALFCGDGIHRSLTIQLRRNPDVKTARGNFHNPAVFPPIPCLAAPEVMWVRRWIPFSVRTCPPALQYDAVSHQA